jgi:anti-anti-sigma factor
MKYQHKINHDLIDNIPVIFIEGDLTSDADGETRGIYSEIKAKHSPDKIIINFQKTTYINSPGLAILLYIIQDVKERGGSIAFVGMSNHLQRVMHIVGISDFVQVFNTNSEAVNNL